MGTESVLKCQTGCLESPASVGRAADSLTQMTVATSVEKLATMPMTATATMERGVADAAGMATLQLQIRPGAKGRVLMTPN